MNRDTEVIVVGGGQAGLSTAYYLKKHNIPHIVLDKNGAIGDVWKSRWDSLTLFTKSEYNNLPGLAFPRMDDFPGKDHVVQYLQAYAMIHEIDVQLQTNVERISKDATGRFCVLTNNGVYTCDHVVVATGECQRAYVPGFAGSIYRNIFQVHSSRYKNPDQIPEGDVLVVGTANSGVQIAKEMAEAGRKVYLSGRDNWSLPAKLAGKDIFWWLTKAKVLDLAVDHPIGKRTILKGRDFGGQLIGYTLKGVVRKHGIKRLSKVVDWEHGELIFAEGERYTPQNIIWATGFRQDFSWIDLPIYNKQGVLKQKRGVVKKVPGLYFSGLKLMHRVGSSLLGSGWKDSRYVVKKIRKKRLSPDFQNA